MKKILTICGSTRSESANLRRFWAAMVGLIDDSLTTE
jgi:hypothetical protein